ncbi:cuticle protein 10.9 [Ixodes scapularis]|uniref:cuticle protein 10.9 n=1 Tax=Ixodes scapularis TaxID=6945 RepID=UPI001125825F|nr:cuticle protein 10.9 [Ixodes scapularis]
MWKVTVICVCLAQWASCQFPFAQQRFAPQTRFQPQPVYTPGVQSYAPQPYSFAYDAIGADGSSSRSESGDASGRVTGYYTITTSEGSRRRVSYVADENGFRATVDTNEHGTADESPADVVFRSTAPKVHGGVTSRASSAQPTFSAPQQQVFVQQRYPFSKA